jgi:hypothetical protein
VERRTLANLLQVMLTHVDVIKNQISSWENRRQQCRDFYADKLSYKKVKDEKITKHDLCSIFIEPCTHQNIDLNAKRFPIHWCHHQMIRIFFGDKWYIVFDIPPCNNCEVPQYFLRKIYCEFILNKILNYFDIREFQGRGGGLTQDRLGA